MPVGVKLPDFNPRPDSACICGSGRAFSECCGTTAAQRRPPPGVMMFPGYIDRDTCRKWVDFLERQPRARAQVLDMQKSSADKAVFVEDEARVCHEVKAGDIQ